MTDPTLAVFRITIPLVLLLIVVVSVARGFVLRRELPAVEGESGAASRTPPPISTPTAFISHYDWLGVAFILLIFCAPALAKIPEVNPLSITPPQLLASVFLQFFMAGVFLAVVKIRTPLRPWLHRKHMPLIHGLWLAPCAVVAIWGLSTVLQFSGFNDWMKTLLGDPSQETIKILQQNPNPWTIASLAFAAVVAAPICEEIVFRGYLYSTLKRFTGQQPAMIFSAFFFAVAHNNLASCIPLLVFGYLLCLLREKTGTILTPILAHFIFNSTTVTLLVLARIYHIPINPDL